MGGADDNLDTADDVSFDIPIGTAATAAAPLTWGPLTLVWNDDSTILQLTSDYQLIHERNYRLQMVDNKAKAADVGGETGLPLILGGGAINLLSGFEFRTGAASTTKDDYPKVDSVSIGQKKK